MKEIMELCGQLGIALGHLEGCKEFSHFVPKTKTCLVYSKRQPQSPEEVLGVEGGITVVDGMPSAAGRPRFGVSCPLTWLIIELSKYDPTLRAGITFVYCPKLLAWLQQHCREQGWIFGRVELSKAPQVARKGEDTLAAWTVKQLLKDCGGKVPTLFYLQAAEEEEGLITLVGPEPVEVVKEMTEIARSYIASLHPMPRVGKIDPGMFSTFLFSRLGKKDKSVLVPPMTGVDAAVIDIGNDKVLIVAEDPIFTIPQYPIEMFGWFTVHIGASDVAVMGVKPQYMTYTLLMPPETSDADFKCLVDSIHKTALELDIAIVGGHTGYYPGFVVPTIGGIAVFAIADKDSYVTPKGAKPGDEVILTKGPAIEAAAILSVARERELLERYPSALVEKAQVLSTQITVVKDALTAMQAGGVHAMHDATEGGVIGGLFEIAEVSNVGMEIDERLFIYPEEVRMVCEAFAIDPVASIAEGSLLICAQSGSSKGIIQRLKQVGIEASVIGKVSDDSTTRIMKRLDGSTVPLAIPEQDPFWPVFFEGLQ